jgi:hypothetical protein
MKGTNKRKGREGKGGEGREGRGRGGRKDKGGGDGGPHDLANRSTPMGRGGRG